MAKSDGAGDHHMSAYRLRPVELEPILAAAGGVGVTNYSSLPGEAVPVITSWDVQHRLPRLEFVPTRATKQVLLKLEAF